jgi:hypothetical protein
MLKLFPLILILLALSAVALVPNNNAVAMGISQSTANTLCTGHVALSNPKNTCRDCKGCSWCDEPKPGVMRRCYSVNCDKDGCDFVVVRRNPRGVRPRPISR